MQQSVMFWWKSARISPFEVALHSQKKNLGVETGGVARSIDRRTDRTSRATTELQLEAKSSELLYQATSSPDV